MIDLFIGDSHSCGYYFDDKAHEWEDNNYAEKFHYLNGNEETVIYAASGCGNYKYAEWFKIALDRHPNIGRVFLQSTYWNRFRIASSRNLDFGFGSYKIDHFTQKTDKNDKITRYNDLKIKDNFVEMQLRPPNDVYEKFKGFRTDFKSDSYNKPMPELVDEYTYTKVWHELQSQLQYIQFCKDLFLIDRLCVENNIDCYVWRINERCHLTDSVEMFGELKKTKILVESAEIYLDNKYDICIADDTIDGEHYNSKTHELIAKDFLPYLLQI